MTTKTTISKTEPTPIPETKPGWKTTEFWFAVTVALGAFLASVADVLPDKYAAIVASAASVAYAVSRGLAKLGVQPTAIFPPKP